MGKKVICVECGSKDDYEFREMMREYEGDGYHFEMLVKIPFCRNCGAFVYSEEIEYEIAQKANSRIREQKKIITREEILEILEAYTISQKLLSKLLGWGEITLTRYINGNYTPSISNSNRLKELKNPYIFQKLLQEDAVKQIVENEPKPLKKIQSKIQCELVKLQETQGKIFDVVNWFLAQASDEAPITHLALQKLLYFTQGWSISLLGREMFNEDCQAWAHGAVYPRVYEYFKKFKYMPLPRVEEEPAFEKEELKVLNAVKTSYFDVYNAKALEEICHRENPYIEVRKDCPQKMPGQEVIDKKIISVYYSSIAEKYKISLDDLSNIKKYIYELLI